MSDSDRPSLQDILDAFERLADRVSMSPTSRLDRFVSVSLRRAAEELRQFIPGLESPPDPEAARFLARAAYTALEDGDAREALARALRGLSFAPHHPGLFYAAASACFEYGAVEDAMRLLRHTLWIHPGHTAARRDLDSLSAYQRDRFQARVERGESVDPAELATDPELAFDFIAEEDPPARGPEGPVQEDDEDRAA